MANDKALGSSRKRAHGFLDAFNRLSNRMLIAAKDKEDRLAIALEAVPTVLQRQQDLIAFYQHYEELVEVLCDVAQCGPADADLALRELAGEPGDHERDLVRSGEAQQCRQAFASFAGCHHSAHLGHHPNCAATARNQRTTGSGSQSPAASTSARCRNSGA